MYIQQLRFDLWFSFYLSGSTLLLWMDEVCQSKRKSVFFIYLSTLTNFLQFSFQLHNFFYATHPVWEQCVNLLKMKLHLSALNCRMITSAEAVEAMVEVVPREEVPESLEHKRINYMAERKRSLRARYAYGIIFLITNLWAWFVRDYAQRVLPELHCMQLFSPSQKIWTLLTLVWSIPLSNLYRSQTPNSNTVTDFCKANIPM